MRAVVVMLVLAVFGSGCWIVVGLDEREVHVCKLGSSTVGRCQLGSK